MSASAPSAIHDHSVVVNNVTVGRVLKPIDRDVAGSKRWYNVEGLVGALGGVVRCLETSDVDIVERRKVV
jgi:hypothetical protein